MNIATEVFEESFKIFLSQQRNKGLPLMFHELYKIDNHVSVKESLLELDTVISWDSNSKEVLVDREQIYQSIANEVYAFNHKAMIQKKNMIHLAKEGVLDSNWFYVTAYYFFFFTASALCRLNNFFVIYLDKDLANRISRIATDYYGQVVSMNANSTLLVKITKYREDDKKLKITLTAAKDQHKSLWIVFSKFLKDYSIKNLNSDTGMEGKILLNIQSFFKETPNLFSTKRNYLNYRFETAFNSMKFENPSSDCWQDLEDIALYLANLSQENQSPDPNIDNLLNISSYFHQLTDIAINTLTDGIKE